MPAVVVAAVVALALAIPARATIVPQKGMAGIRIGMTKGEVRGVLGRPLRIVRATGGFGPYTVFHYPALVQVFFGRDVTVTNIRTTGRRERTARGAGVGSTEDQVKRAVPGLRCERFRSFRDCYLGRFLPGRRVTLFRLRGGRVVQVDVGVVLD